ncbi:MAG: serine/threonine protein kinase [Paracoccaceae bacterium]|nr:serine/threonine protein kinase [Paracoccaceae bacterium]
MSVEEPTVEPEEWGDELPPGTALFHGQYTIERHLRSGGFGITYLALDSLKRRVVIKECFPEGMCVRPSRAVRARSRNYGPGVATLIQKFIREAQSLARIKHPNVVRVHQVFEDNDTAYMVLDYIQGRELGDEIAENPLSPLEIRAALLQLLDAVAVIHDAGLLHRDISPDNIMLDAHRKPVLIDFGAARDHAPGGERPVSTVHVVKDGYSPQELYMQGAEQGPWSDLYALAATFHHLIAGEPPPNSQVRLAALATGAGDPYQPLAGRFDDYDPAFLEAIDKALSVLARERIQSARDWMARLTGEMPAPPRPVAPAVPVQAPPPAARQLTPTRAAAAVAAVLAVGAMILATV